MLSNGKAVFALTLTFAVLAPAQPFLARHCQSCHNPNLKSGNLDLTSTQHPPATWSKVREKIATGKMPPPGLPIPSKAEVTTYLATLPAAHDAPLSTGPGRVTARRLNRTEYNNTIRDLLGVHIRPADEFPVDDSGYGFDNIGDVLTVSPMLMEKYVAAAKKVSRLAIYGETLPAQPGVMTRLMARRSYDGGGLDNSSTYLPYSMRGALYGSYVFPVDAEYELRFRVMNLREDERKTAGDGTRTRRASLASLTPEERVARLRAIREGSTPEALRENLAQARVAAPPLQVQFAVDGKVALMDVIEGTSLYGYDRGEFVARVPLKAGPHSFRASFPELADLEDPRKHLNPDLRRKVFVDYLDIAGPFQPSAEPPASYRHIFVCGHPRGAHQAACARRVVTELARKAYRRTPSVQEVSGLERLVAMVRKEGDSLEEGVRVALQAVLVSPQFLFRIETEPLRASTARSIGPQELASRLSYFLWASMPDEELLRSADSGDLVKPAVLEVQVRRMLADPKSSSLVEDFADQWLQLRDLDRRRPAPERFPALDDELLDSMRRETRMFVSAIFREDRSLLDFLDAPFAFVNGPLARHYGLPGVKGEEFVRVTLDGEQRGGLLTQAAILTVSSYPNRTSPVIRGKWVLENLLGTPPPPPPANVPELEDAKTGVTASMREQLETHRANPVCASCHSQMDPLGFALENYDATGAWRTHDGKFLIDSSGALPGGRTIKGSKELKQVLRERSALFTRNVSEKLLTYALGRGLEPYDGTAVDEIARSVKAGDDRFSTLVLAIVNSKPFRMRSGVEAGGLKP